MKKNSKLGGQTTFIKNMLNSQSGAELMNHVSLYIAGNPKPIGTGSMVASRIDGVYFHQFKNGANTLNRHINNTIFNKNLIKNYNKSEKIIFQSNFSKYCFAKLYGNRVDKPFTVITNSADRNIFFPDFDLNLGTLKIISVSLDYPIKRLHYFQHFSDELENRGIRHEITIISSLTSIKHRMISRFQSSLNSLAKNPNINVILNQNSEQVAGYLRGSNIYVSFSHIDPCPNAIAEAVACGIPIVAPDSGGIPDLALKRNLYTKKLDMDLFCDWFSYEVVDKEEIKIAVDKVQNVAENYKDEKCISLDFSVTYPFEKMVSHYKDFLI